ncbi:hypothetical protein V7147_14360 [Bacillus sp. JJ1521]|uniref:hypothetical protein n=1 Tax=Bacillus sp. JJ1521 TaxID=3122957 RepID=UPI00300034C5
MNRKLILVVGIFFALLLSNSIQVNGAGKSVSLDPDDRTLTMDEVEFGKWSTSTESGKFDATKSLIVM